MADNGRTLRRIEVYITTDTSRILRQTKVVHYGRQKSYITADKSRTLRQTKVVYYGRQSADKSRTLRQTKVVQADLTTIFKI